MCFWWQLAALEGDFKLQLAQHPRITFAATVGHLCHAIRKLSAVATEEEASNRLWRGVRGELPQSFWLRDESGRIIATDVAFMSTSRMRKTPIEYMAGGGESNVLFCLKPRSESDSGFHRGADVSALSQFAGEKEVLFPPYTMLTVLEETTQRNIREQVEESGKCFVSLEVLPTFI